MMIESILSQEQPLVEVRDLSIEFYGQTVLRDINLSIPAGQTLVLLGESGCGKTVLMKTLIGLIKPTRGRVIFDGLDLHTLSDQELSRLRLRFGFVFQNAALFDSMSIAQNLAFPMRQHGDFSTAQIQELVSARLAEVGLPKTVLRKKPAELSGGMRKRVGLARALIMNPEVILYDEPTTGLDPIMTDVINQLIIRTRRRGPVTSVIVTHAMETARRVPDRVVMLYPISRLDPHEPQIVYDGPPGELDQCRDRRVRQFVNGEAGQRLMELVGDNEG
ncbi:MAG: ATP-binding cassette domain-containing protein [Pirellulaceae bacterium]|jgi:phospholipid/cholesterol/gamma-HCH transport system ATP-binding protein|nr:ATP-binding cassette domain-containing protein [Pirellulaceae bacterium]